MKQYKIFNYYPIDVKQSYTGKNVKGFKFPANGKQFDETNVADVENLQQIQLYFGINEVISSLEDLIRTGSTKTSKLYKILINDLKEDYKRICVLALEFASSLCWVRMDPDKPNENTCKYSPDVAIAEVEPFVKACLYLIQRKMDLVFPAQLVKNVARLEIEKDLIELEETTGAIKKSLKR